MLALLVVFVAMAIFGAFVEIGDFQYVIFGALVVLIAYFARMEIEDFRRKRGW